MFVIQILSLYLFSSVSTQLFTNLGQVCDVSCSFAELKNQSQGTVEVCGGCWQYISIAVVIIGASCCLLCETSYMFVLFPLHNYLNCFPNFLLPNLTLLGILLLQAKLEALVNEEEKQKSDALTEALLSELALDTKKNTSEGNSDPKLSKKTSKTKKKIKGLRKVKDPKVSNFRVKLYILPSRLLS